MMDGLVRLAATHNRCWHLICKQSWHNKINDVIFLHFLGLDVAEIR